MLWLIFVLAVLFLFSIMIARRQRRRFRSQRRKILDRYRDRIEEMDADDLDPNEASRDE